MSIIGGFVWSLFPPESAGMDEEEDAVPAAPQPPSGGLQGWAKTIVAETRAAVQTRPVSWAESVSHSLGDGGLLQSVQAAGCPLAWRGRGHESHTG